MSPERRLRLRLLVIALLATLSGIALTVARPALLAGPAALVSDHYFRFDTRTPDPRVLLVAVDHRSVKALGRWPWDRAQLATGLARLSEARVVALDMVFSEATDAAADARLAETLMGLNSVGGFFLNGTLADLLDAEQQAALMASALTDVEPGPQPYLEARELELNIPAVQQAVILAASLNTLPDPDGLFRAYPLAFVLHGELFPTLAIQALRLYSDDQLAVRSTPEPVMDIAGRRLHPGTRGVARLNYYPVESYRTVSFVDLLQGRVAAEALRDAIVIIGVTETGVADVRSTPMGQMPGPLLHYTFVSNLLDGSVLQEQRVAELLLVLACGLLPLLAVRTLRAPPARVLLYGAALVALFAAGVLAYRAHGWLEAFYPMATLVVSALACEAALFAGQERQARYLRAAFGSYIAPSLISDLMDRPELLALGGTVKEATFLFSDIRNFTTLAEQADAATLAATLNELFSPLTEAIIIEGGMLDKYIGDAIMAVFNAPHDLPDHPLRACRAALGMLERLHAFNERRRQAGQPPLDIGIGINTGRALIGNLGSRFRFNYTAVGDAVNLASRLEGMNKQLGTHIIIGESTYLAVRHALACRPLGEVTVKGKREPQPVYELVGRMPGTARKSTAQRKDAEGAENAKKMQVT